MKRFFTTLMFVGLLGLVGMPKSAEAGIFSRWFHCGSSAPATVSAAATPTEVASNAAENVESGRRYSYEPGVVNVPEVRRERPSRVPSYMLPKTDPRKYTP